MKYVLSLILLSLALIAQEKPLPSNEYDKLRAAELVRNATLRALEQKQALARAEYRRIFQEIESRHKGYVLQPERLVLIKKPDK